MNGALPPLTDIPIWHVRGLLYLFNLPHCVSVRAHSLFCRIWI